VSARITSVNIVHALIPDQRGDLDRTAIDKRPVPGRIAAQRLGLEGDRQYDRRHHGGPDKALYAYAREDTDWWSRELDRELTDGQFGENLTTTGLDITGAEVGERWQIGSDGLEVEVTMARIPCATFQGWLGEPRWVKRFFAHGAPGAYLRVTSEGGVAAGDDVQVVHRPGHGITLGDVFLLGDLGADRLRRLLEQPQLAEALAVAARRVLRAVG